MPTTRHKCFISFHRADHDAVVAFKRDFDDRHDAFIFRGQEMPEDIIRSTNDDYVMSRIRDRFLKDSTVTIVLVSSCTWSRKFVDWEVKASLQRPAYGVANGGARHRAEPGLAHESSATTSRACQAQRRLRLRQLSLVSVHQR